MTKPHDRSSSPRRHQDHSGPSLARAGDYDVIDCAPCGFAHVLPLPSEKALAETYAQDYYSQEKPDYLAAVREDEAWFALAHDDRLDALASLGARPPARLLDIGCGPGHFLARAVARGYDAIGLEPSRQAAAHARAQGLSVRESFFTDEAAARLAPVHAVHMMNVLEHVPDPAAIVARVARVLAPRGVLCIGVPNDFNPLQRMLSDGRSFARWWIAPPHHLNYFTYGSLEGLLVRHDLVPRARLTSFPMELFLALGENYVGDSARGRACHQRRKALDQDLEATVPGARRALYGALAQAGFGREAIIVATKASS